MELRQLEYFVAVAEEQHFTRAAKRLQVAQSGLSASIQSLERELGAPLFIRNTRRVELTDAGRALLGDARRALTTVAAARDAVAAVRGLLRGTLAVGTLQCLCAVDLPAALARFNAAHPGVEIRLRHGGSTELVDEIRTGGLDLAFVSVPARPVEGVDFAPLAAEPLVLACGPGHRLAGRPEVDLADLRGEAFVDFSPGWGARDAADRALAAARVDRWVAFEVNDIHSLLDLVGHGLGVALVPSSFSGKKTAARFVPLRGPAPVWEVAVATAAGRPPSAAARALLAESALLPVPA